MKVRYSRSEDVLIIELSDERVDYAEEIRLFSDKDTEEITAVEMMLEKLTEHVEVNLK